MLLELELWGQSSSRGARAGRRAAQSPGTSISSAPELCTSAQALTGTRRPSPHPHRSCITLVGRALLAQGVPVAYHPMATSKPLMVPWDMGCPVLAVGCFAGLC